jgi:predicted DNA-binding WGR domain protein
MVIAMNVSPATQLEIFAEALHLRCVDLAKNKRRFYAMSVERTLFGEWSLVREWGPIGRGGRVRREVFGNAGEAVDALVTLARRKMRRGYETTPLTQRGGVRSMKPTV